ncbi:B-cell lymphoma 3 protein like, partial [Pseudolycoriella hygida]
MSDSISKISSILKMGPSDKGLQCKGELITITDSKVSSVENFTLNVLRGDTKKRLDAVDMSDSISEISSTENHISEVHTKGFSPECKGSPKRKLEPYAIKTEQNDKYPIRKNELNPHSYESESVSKSSFQIINCNSVFSEKSSSYFHFIELVLVDNRKMANKSDQSNAFKRSAKMRRSPVDYSKSFSCRECKRPDSFEDMVECTKCRKWFHYSCAQVDEAVKNISWECKNCTTSRVVGTKTAQSDNPKGAKPKTQVNKSGDDSCKLKDALIDQGCVQTPTSMEVATTSTTNVQSSSTMVNPSTVELLSPMNPEELPRTPLTVVEKPPTSSLVTSTSLEIPPSTMGNLYVGPSTSQDGNGLVMDDKSIASSKSSQRKKQLAMKKLQEEFDLRAQREREYLNQKYALLENLEEEGDDEEVDKISFTNQWLENQVNKLKQSNFLAEQPLVETIPKISESMPPDEFYSFQCNEKITQFNEPYQSIVIRMEEEMRTAFVCNEEGLYTIHQATINGDIFKIRRLLVIFNFYKRDINITSTDGKNETPLHYAMSSIRNPRNNDIINLLIDRGAEVLAVNDDGDTVLHLAAETIRDYSIASKLISKISLDDLSKINDKGRTVLHIAASNFVRPTINAAKVKILNEQDGRTGKTAVFLSLDNTDESVALMLMAHFADTRIPDFNNTTCSFYCTEILKNRRLAQVIYNADSMHKAVVAKTLKGPERPRSFGSSTHISFDEDNFENGSDIVTKVFS